MIRKILIATGISIFFFSSVHSQTPPVYHYTSTDGLAAETVYDIKQDKNGFIWFGTINGLNRFDGNRFITYRISDGLNSNSITALCVGKQNELYIGSHQKGINILRNGEIENYINEINGKQFSLNYLVELDDTLYGSEPNKDIIFVNKGVGSSLNTMPFIINRLALTKNKNILALTSKGLFKPTQNKLEKIEINQLPEVELFSLANDEDGSFLVGGEGIIYRIKNNKVIEQYSVKLFEKNIVFNLLIDSKRNIWFSIRGKGFYKIPYGSDKIIDIGIKLGLEKTQVNCMLEDNEGNIWITPFGKGVYCLNNLFINSYSENDGLINNYINSFYKTLSGKLIIGTFNGISILNNGVIETLKYNSGQIVTGYISNIIQTNKYLTISLTSEVPKSTLINYRDLDFRLTQLQSFCETSEGLFLFGTGWNIIDVQKEFHFRKIPNSFFNVFKGKNLSNRINHIVEDSKKNIWIGSNLGLCKLTYQKENSDIKKWEKTFFQNDSVLNSKISFIYKDKDENLWFAGANGIAKHDFSSNSITNYTKIMDYDLSNSTSIAIDKQNRLWIGNMKGVYVYDGKSVEHIDSQSGLNSNEVNSLYYDEKLGKMYIGTSNGFSELDINSFIKYNISPPKIFVNKIISRDFVYTNFNSLEFERDDNNIRIDISALNFSSPRSIIYKYNLNGNWYETKNSVLNFSSLQNGKYNLEIIARTQNSDWSKPYFLAFEIKPSFTETVWFKAGFFLLVFSFALSVVLWRMKQKTIKINEQLELNERINSLKHQALSAMMNPHFIFNSLNSVQYLVNSNRNEEANNYIAMMAKLIRKNLDIAGSGFILLSEEINRLKLYLDLEKLRFQERFSYDIIFGDDVNADSILIPNMIIQPFVENSLWHGIINSGMNGNLKISFLFENIEIDSAVSKSLIIKVTDNGIGIMQARKINKEDHISKGIQIIEERLKLLSTKLELPKPIILEDLSERNNNSRGTEVIISLSPPMYKFILTE